MEQESKQQQLNIALIGITPEACAAYIDLSKHNVNVIDNNSGSVMNEIEPHPDIILCGSNLKDITTIELGQTLRMQCLNKEPIYYICTNLGEYTRKILIKNGFTDVFITPFDGVIIKESIQNFILQKFKDQVSGYRPIKLLDIHPQTQLDFDVYVRLPMNKKYIKLCPAGTFFEQERLDYLNQHQVKWIYIEIKDTQKFYDYNVRILKDIQSSRKTSETERIETLKTAIRNLISGIFDTTEESSFQTGQAILQDCQEIVKSYVLTTQEGEWYKKFLEVFAENSDNYTKTANMATFAFLFSIGLDLPQPEEVALAGLLCDIGLVEVPTHIQEKLDEQRSAEEREIYNQHPIYSLNVLKQRKVSLSDRVIRAITEQHENFDGSGYPAKLSGKNISVEGQILSLSYYFTEMLTSRDGRKRRTPMEVLQFIQHGPTEDGKTILFDPDLIEELLGLFPKAN